ncbi:hypothetical protein BN134_1411 [Cronobacter dublinensis 1210]|uniref:Uncharacterized protein n=1 Tax=Cronobacter dublinensis 1210 TaxID=1208656 RepID=A0ABP1W7Z3_9ENTR|nr:hypothetical protein BN134_1411 [Cronobacter dublinensis 1210]
MRVVIRRSWNHADIGIAHECRPFSVYPILPQKAVRTSDYPHCGACNIFMLALNAAVS